MSHIRKTIEWYYDHYFVAPFFSKEYYLKRKFKKRVGYPLNLKSPKTFCEKIQWLKFNMQRSDFTMMVDKVDAKKYVADIIGSEHIIKTYGVWDSVTEVDWNSLPNSFVIKVTNDSGGIVICKDKGKLDINETIRKLGVKSANDYSKYNMEYPYQNLRSRIIAEELMVNGTDAELKDYKLYCFNGKAEYCQVIADRKTDETIDFYDRQWSHQPFIGLNPKVHHAVEPIAMPLNYQEMLVIADKISTKINHPFVRVDLYNVNGNIYFGEITFFPSSGMGHIQPLEWDRRLGELIKLPID